ncbi:anhydro-N-acetylmuramic acid kinase [Phormidium yuhuli AB48]|uniref:Anhydro-N-acetylmuramic acid kinase n=2 Tax=Phormidium TaxID=1198 RepID=A0ABY5ARZ5_9CYAN|nr:anhydro-N-acetylmuramic acid kinase [Phormidium yuhuli]USR91992.1 anhydro-N-acetylmuramic acid kinase [Phormidium yuhuli AB48]
MSGTSIDGVDAALVELSGGRSPLKLKLLAAQTFPYEELAPPNLRSQLLAAASNQPLPLSQLAQLDNTVAQAFARAAQRIQTHQPPAQLIGSHGQTVFHAPPPHPGHLGYSLQLGRGDLIAHHSGLPTVSNFRAADIAVGGQGAPLVPPIDACLLAHPQRDRCIQNLGGIGNVTYLPAGCHQNFQGILGWDTGPANILIDLAITQLTQGKQQYDHNGQWAACGTPDPDLVQQWLTHPFFQQPPPKSTGREDFGPELLQQYHQQAQHLGPADWLATLTDLTAASIADSYKRFLPQLPQDLILCGGGSRNPYLKSRLQTHLPQTTLSSSDDWGLNADFKEAIAFAILAYWRLQGHPSNLPSVTGASKPVPLGDIHPP